MRNERSDPITPCRAALHPNRKLTGISVNTPSGGEVRTFCCGRADRPAGRRKGGSIGCNAIRLPSGAWARNCCTWDSTESLGIWRCNTGRCYACGPRPESYSVTDEEILDTAGVQDAVTPSADAQANFPLSTLLGIIINNNSISGRLLQSTMQRLHTALDHQARQHASLLGWKFIHFRVMGGLRYHTGPTFLPIGFLICPVLALFACSTATTALPHSASG